MWEKHPVFTNYLIHPEGRVRHKNSTIDRKTRTDKYGYLRLNLWFDGKNRTVMLHKLVADCFVPNPKDYPTINHIDGDKNNNTSSNLEWMTFSDNTKDSFTRNHPICMKVEIDGTPYRSKREAERETGISRHKMSNYSQETTL